MVVEIFLRNYNGGTNTVVFGDSEFRSTTVLDLKNRIELLSGVPVHQQRLIYVDKQLEDNTLLSDYGILNGSIIHLVLQLRGGGSSQDTEDLGMGDRAGRNRSMDRLSDFRDCNIL